MNDNVTRGRFPDFVPPQGSLKGSGGDGTSDDMLARVAKLEAHIEHIRSDISGIKSDIGGLRSDARTDFRLVFGALIAVAVGLAGLLAKGFHWF